MTTFHLWCYYQILSDSSIWNNPIFIIYKCISLTFRAREALRQCLPDQLKDQTFASCLKDDTSTKRWLAQLLKNLESTAASATPTTGISLQPALPWEVFMWLNSTLFNRHFCFYAIVIFSEDNSYIYYLLSQKKDFITVYHSFL